MSERFPNDALGMPDKYLRYTWQMFEIFLRHALYAQHMAEKCLMYSSDMPGISVKNAWNKP